MNRKYRYLLTAATAVAAAGLLTFGSRNDFGLGRNMEIAVNMMRELSVGYVDPVDPDKLMLGAAQGMVRDLDPYTEFIPAEEMSDFELMTTGKYGGIGSLIRKKGDRVVIAQPYKGSPADRAGLKIGDRILAIDGKDAQGFSTEQVSAALKGDPGTKVKISVEHLDGTQQTFVLTRERIAIPSVPYAGWVADSIGYLRHSDFTEGSYEELRAAIERLRQERPLGGLILDYRSNGGGILQEAVKILSLFVPKGTEVVSTKGRTERSKQTYRTASEPAFPDLPLVVLINGSTASAAEIVAGALQDLDRAVLIGQRSFGKGLVQSTRPLGYNAMLKLTTAKYYIPSGRCIQAIDYSHSQEGAVSAVPDSLVSEFATRAGRKVYDGGGIMPDLPAELEYISRFAATLYALGFIDDFGDEYMRRHPEAPADLTAFSISDADYDDFRKFMQDKQVPYESDSRRALRQLRDAAKADRFDAVGQQIAAIEERLHDDTQANIETYRKEIERSINSDIVLRHGYTQGVIARSLPDDKEVRQAVALLGDPQEYARILSEQDTRRK
ncbi:MAG: S41 family peptidase [Alistipes sp.]|nr:S41 family peptidase [Alistipes sp.]